MRLLNFILCIAVAVSVVAPASAQHPQQQHPQSNDLSKYFFLEDNGYLLSISDKDKKIVWVRQSSIKDAKTLYSVLWHSNKFKTLFNVLKGSTIYSYENGYIYTTELMVLRTYVKDKHQFNQIPLSMATQDKLIRPNVLELIPQISSSIDKFSKKLYAANSENCKRKYKNLDPSYWFALERNGYVLNITSINPYSEDIFCWRDNPLNNLYESLWRYLKGGYLVNARFGQTDYKLNKKGQLKTSYGYIYDYNGDPRVVDANSLVAGRYPKVELNRLIVATKDELSSDPKSIANSLNDSLIVVRYVDGVTNEDIAFQHSRLRRELGLDNTKNKRFRYKVAENIRLSGVFDSVESISALGKKAVDVLNSGSYYYNGYTIEFDKDEIVYKDGYYQIRQWFKELKIGAYDEDYNQPYEVCIPRPSIDCNVKMSPTKWIISEKQQIQTMSTSTVRQQGITLCAAPPTMREYTPPLGTSNTTYKIFQNKDVPSILTCSRKIYQTPRTNKRSRVTRGGQVVTQALVGSDGDLFAPWRIVYNLRYNIDIKWLEEKLSVPLNVQALLWLHQLANNQNLSEVLTPASIQSTKTDIVVAAALYKTYKLHNTEKLRADVLRSTKQLEANGHYWDAIFLYKLVGDEQSMARLCDTLFLACQSPAELVRTLNGVCSIISRDNALDWKKCLFAGVKRFDSEPLYPRSIVNQMHPNAECLFLKEFWRKQSEFCDLSYLPQFDEYATYLKSVLTASCCDPNYTRLIRSASESQVTDVISHLKSLVTLDLLSMLLQLCNTISVAEYEEIEMRLGIIEELIKEIGMKNFKENYTNDSRSVALQIRKIRAKMSTLQVPI